VFLGEGQLEGSQTVSLLAAPPQEP